MSNSISQNLFRDPLLNVFSYLDPENLQNTTKVCKVWHEVSENKKLWHALATQKGIVDAENYKEAVINQEKMEKSLEKGELKLLHTLQNDQGVYSLFIMKDSMLSGHTDGTVKFWQKKEGFWEVADSFESPMAPISQLSYLDGKLYLQYDEQQEMKVFEKQNGTWVEIETVKKEGNKKDDVLIGKYKIRADGCGLVFSIKDDETQHVLGNTWEYYTGINTVQYFQGKLFTGDSDGRIGQIKIWGPFL